MPRHKLDAGCYGGARGGARGSALRGRERVHGVRAIATDNKFTRPLRARVSLHINSCAEFLRFARHLYFCPDFRVVPGQACH
jgi:hypothetical protein